MKQLSQKRANQKLAKELKRERKATKAAGEKKPKPDPRDSLIPVGDWMNDH